MKTLNEQFYDFCSKKPKDEHYSYFDIKTCACTQFAESIGVNYISRSYYYDLERIASRVPHTFGALTERMEEFLANEPPPVIR